MLRRIALIVLATSCLSACWVPQVVQGVQPKLFPSAAPSVTPFADITLEGKIVALSTRVIAISRRTSALLALSAQLAAHRQALENHVYYSVKASGEFSGWAFAGGIYSYYDAFSGARYSLSMIDTQNQPSGFDVLGFGSYGSPPLPAKSFPTNVYRYQLQLQQPDTVAGDTLKLDLKGSWPVQIPLRGSFQTLLSGSGSDDGHAVFKQLSMRVDGKSSSDGSLVEGQIGFSAEIDGQIYNGFGTLDGLGLLGTVQIEQNGIPVAAIVRRDKRWDVEINGRVSATGD